MCACVSEIVWVSVQMYVYVSLIVYVCVSLLYACRCVSFACMGMSLCVCMCVFVCVFVCLFVCVVYVNKCVPASDFHILFDQKSCIKDVGASVLKKAAGPRFVLSHDILGNAMIKVPRMRRISVARLQGEMDRVGWALLVVLLERNAPFLTALDA